MTGDKIDPAAKLKLIKAEEEAIAREKEEDDKAAQDQKEKVEQEAKAAEEVHFDFQNTCILVFCSSYFSNVQNKNQVFYSITKQKSDQIIIMHNVTFVCSSSFLSLHVSSGRCHQEMFLVSSNSCQQNCPPSQHKGTNLNKSKHDVLSLPLPSLAVVSSVTHLDA